MNAESGEGEPLAETLRVDGYPTFILVDAAGAVVDRWSGFDEAKAFLTELRRGTSDPVPVVAKERRFASSPTLADAETLARIAGEDGRPADALRYLADAQRLNPSQPEAYLAQAFDAHHALWRDGGPVEPVRASADALLAAKSCTLRDAARVARVMGRVAKKLSDPSIVAPYLDQAIAAAEASDEASARDLLADLRMRKALEVDQDVSKALALKRASMPAGWQEDADQLNAFAWWCFENATNLDEAEQLARKGVELAPAGAKRAMILDTLAEICNARGNCGDAVEFEARAAREDPANEHYKERLAEFEKLLAEQTGGTVRI